MEHLRDVEVALFGEEPAIVVELIHLQHPAPAQPAAQLVSELSLPADLEAVAPGIVGAVVGEGARVGGHRREVAQPLGGEALIGDHRRDADGLLLGKAPGPGGSDEALLQVHAGLARTEGATVAAVVLGVHAAIGEHREAQRLGLGDLAVVAEMGDQEGLVLALPSAGHQVEGLRTLGAATLDAALPVRREELGADIRAVTDEGHARRVSGRGDAVLGQGGAGAGHALVNSAVAMGEVTVGCQCLGRGEGRQHQQGVLESHRAACGSGEGCFALPSTA